MFKKQSQIISSEVLRSEDKSYGPCIHWEKYQCIPKVEGRLTAKRLQISAGSEFNPYHLALHFTAEIHLNAGKKKRQSTKIALDGILCAFPSGFSSWGFL